jgi:hypothetical protein
LQSESAGHTVSLKFDISHLLTIVSRRIAGGRYLMLQIP